MKSIIFNLTNDMIRVETITHDQNIFQIGPFKNEFDSKPLIISKLEIRASLDLIQADPINNQVFIVLQMTPARIAAAFMIAGAMTQANIPCKIQIHEQKGECKTYVAIDEWLQEGYDWAMCQSSQFKQMEEMNSANWLEAVSERL